MKIEHKIAVTALFSFALISCTANTDKKISSIETKTNVLSENHAEKHWSYEGETGPTHWAEIEKDSECNGKSQSPINIETVNAAINDNLKPLDIHYTPNTKINTVKNNGHSIQYDFEEGDYINYKGSKFNLKQFHFHESSEHTIDGIRYPMAIHLVHANKEGELLVLAVMAKQGLASAPFDFLESYLPLAKDEVKTVGKPFDLNLNLPENKGYYNYTGSLTTPPCSEGVNWFVFKEPIAVSKKQVEILKNLMPIDNYRNEQALNGRVVSMTR